MTQQTAVTADDLAGALDLIAGEHRSVIAATDTAAWAQAAERIRAAPRVFTVGSGRSGLALQMVAMRLMHLGKDAHVVGEASAPAIGADDVLLAASGSGHTSRVVDDARTATEAGACVLAVTTDPDSELAGLATVTLQVAAADKQDFDGEASAQYAGSLFEQSVLLLGDALFHTLWATAGDSARELWRNHANLD